MKIEAKPMVVSYANLLNGDEGHTSEVALLIRSSDNKLLDSFHLVSKEEVYKLVDSLIKASQTCWG